MLAHRNRRRPGRSEARRATSVISCAAGERKGHAKRNIRHTRACAAPAVHRATDRHLRETLLGNSVVGDEICEPCTIVARGVSGPNRCPQPGANVGARRAKRATTPILIRPRLKPQYTKKEHQHRRVGVKMRCGGTPGKHTSQLKNLPPMLFPQASTVIPKMARLMPSISPITFEHARKVARHQKK